jgi:hypothetical protein
VFAYFIVCYGVFVLQFYVVDVRLFVVSLCVPDYGLQGMCQRVPTPLGVCCRVWGVRFLVSTAR